MTDHRLSLGTDGDLWREPEDEGPGAMEIHIDKILVRAGHAADNGITIHATVTRWGIAESFVTRLSGEGDVSSRIAEALVSLTRDERSGWESVDAETSSDGRYP